MTTSRGARREDTDNDAGAQSLDGLKVVGGVIWAVVERLRAAAAASSTSTQQRAAVIGEIAAAEEEARDDRASSKLP